MRRDFQRTKYLGLDLQKTQDGYTVSQGTFIRKLALEEKKLLDHPPCTTTPIATNFELGQGQAADRRDYQSLLGSLLWLSSHTRPDLAYAVSLLSSVASKPTTGDLIAAKRVFAYALNTADKGIRYYKQQPEQHQHFISFVDANHGNEIEFKSRSAYVIFYAGGPIAWFSKTQPVTATSTNYSELVALFHLTERLRAMAIMSSSILDSPIFSINCDSRGALSVLNSINTPKKAKSIAIKYFSTRDFLRDFAARLYYVGTGSNVADTFTKPLDRATFRKLTNQLVVLVSELNDPTC